ncbi:copia protein [Tanacetum coccineum]
MFSVCLCARFQEDPKTSHLEAVKRIFRYIKGITHLGLWYPKGSDIETITYEDSDHAGDYVDHKSTSGVCTFMGCCLTSWFLKKQTALAISTTEAEYVSAGKACQQALWMKQALVDYGIRLDNIPIMCDNKWAIGLSKNPVQHSRTKHIEIRHHFLRDNVQKGNISIEKVSSEDNIADILTKPLKRETFNYLRLEQDLELGSTSGIRACALRTFDLENIEFETTQNNALTKLPLLKLGDYEMWEMRIKQYFRVLDYSLWDIIENGNSWVPTLVATTEGGATSTKVAVPATEEEKACKKNDIKVRSLLLMSLPNEHQLTFDQYEDAQSMFIAIKARFGGNEATKKTQKALLKQQYENFYATSSESLDSIFNRFQKLVSRLVILGVIVPPEDLNLKFLKNDLYNNFKIVEQKIKKSAGSSNGDKNLAFVTSSRSSNTIDTNTAIPEVSTASIKVNTASTTVISATFSDATIYAFLASQPKGSQLFHEDLEQLHDDDLEDMDLKWNMALLSMRARKFYQRTGRKITIEGSNTAGYDKSKVECFNCHKLGHFARECRSPRTRSSNQEPTRKPVIIEDTTEKAMMALDGVGFD